MADVNTIARRLVEAYFGLSPDGILNSVQKRAYSKLFNASNRLLEIFMEWYGLNLDEAAGHLDKAAIERMAGITYTPVDDEPPKAVSAPAEAPVQAPKIVKKEQTMDEYITELLDELYLDPVLVNVIKNILDEPIPEAGKARLLKPIKPSKFKLRQAKDKKPMKLSKQELALFEEVIGDKKPVIEEVVGGKKHSRMTSI